MFQEGHRQTLQEGSSTRSHMCHWIMQTLDYMGALGNNFTQPHSQGECIQSNTEHRQRS